MKNKIVFLLVLLLVIPLVCGLDTLKNAKLNQDYTILQTCDDATWINISISNLNGIILANVPMVNEGAVWSYHITPTNLSRHDVSYISDGCEKSGASYFEVTQTGQELTPAKSSTYIIILIISILIFAVLVYFGLAMPSSNKKDEYTGYILATNNLKYIKYIILGFAYITLIWISYFSWMLIYSYLDFDFLSEIFKILFITISYLTIPLLIFFFWINIANILRDMKIKDMLLRGLRTNGDI